MFSSVSRPSCIREDTGGRATPEEQKRIE
jgi:hypothetical protein